MTKEDLFKTFGNPDHQRLCHCGTCRQAVELAAKIVAQHPEIFDNGETVAGDVNPNCPSWGVQVAYAIQKIAEAFLIRALARDGYSINDYGSAMRNIGIGMTTEMVKPDVMYGIVDPFVERLLGGSPAKGD